MNYELGVMIFLCAVATFCAVMMLLHDWRERIIPDIYLFPFLLVGFIVAGNAFAAAVGYSLGAGANWIWGLARPSRGACAPAIGFGDVKLLAAGGAWLGLTGLSIAIVASCIFGGTWGLWRRQKFIPFAPFFFAGMTVALVFQHAIFS